MRVLISGAGIAGPTLAYWLAHYGLQPTIVENAPRLRTGGYIIDFWGAGFEIAARMDLVPDLNSRGYKLQEVRVVDSTGRRVAGFPADAFARITQGRYVSLPRGELAAAIFAKIAGNVEVLFGDSIAQIEQSKSAARVLFESGRQHDFDLVIGADGLHSHVRELVFGEANQFEKYLGYKAAAFELPGYRPRDELVYLMCTEVGQQVARFAMRGDRTMFLFTYADPAAPEPATGGLGDTKNELRTRFANTGWECPQILERLDTAEQFYFDRVSQVSMGPAPGSWSKGRVSLLGDAAFAVSLLAGQGSALAMISAYILAGELYRARDDYALAFARYQELFGQFILRKQKAALRFAGMFAPKSRLALFLRNQGMNLMTIPWVADLAVGRDLADRIAIPEY